MTKKQRVFNLMRRRWVSVKDSNRLCGLNSLAQRVSEWTAAGIKFERKWVTEAGSRFRAYRVAQPKVRA